MKKRRVLLIALIVITAIVALGGLFCWKRSSMIAQGVHPLQFRMEYGLERRKVQCPVNRIS